MFKEFHIPGATATLILSIALLSMIYFYLGIVLFTGVKLKSIFKKESYKSLTTGKIIGSILVGVLLSTMLLGILFKLVNWPGATIMLLTPIMGFIIPFLLIVINYLKSKSDFYKNLLIRVVVIGGFGVFLYLLPPFAILEHYHKDNPEYIEVEKQLAKDPENKELQKKSTELRFKSRH